MAGGHGKGDALSQVNNPDDFDIDDDGALVVSDDMNHQIMRWEPYATEDKTIVGEEGRGNRLDQLDRPSAVLIDRRNDSLITSEYGNRRVMRWSLDKQEGKRGEGVVIISNINCLGLAFDNQGSLYVSDFEKHEVRRYGSSDRREGVIVAGGNGPGSALHQLKCPRNVFVDHDQSVYISDRDNHRVMKWTKDAKQGEVLVSGNGRGSENNQLFWPTSASFDHNGNFYVDDKDNHRIQCFNLQHTASKLKKCERKSRVKKDQFDNRGNQNGVDRHNH